MDAYLIVIGLGIVAAGILLLPLWGARQRQGLRSMLSRYQTIVDAVLADDLVRAREELKEIIRVDTDDIGAYLKLAQVFRREGDRERSIAIHRSLTAREIADRGVKVAVLSGLAEDLMQMQRYGEARPVAEALRQIDRRHPLPNRVELHQSLEREDWDGVRRALAALRRAGRAMADEEADRIRVWVAARMSEGGSGQDARKLLEEVLRDRPDQVPAALLLGDSWAEEGHFERAADVWTELLRRRIDAAPHLLHRLEKSYFELGRFGELERLYAEVIGQERPGSGVVRLALARMALRKGDPARGLALVEEALQREPEDPQNKKWHVYLQIEAGLTEAARRVLKQELEATIEQAQQRRCPYCRQSNDAAVVRCLHCQHWLADIPVTPPAVARHA
ncbi:MAG: tetratricopeptide repeat protein [Candidatus Eisenbacteria bacterium]